MTYLEKLYALNSHREEGPAAERICSEIAYLDGISGSKEGKYDKEIELAADLLLERIADDGVITAKTVEEAEALLADLAPVAKSYTEYFVSHAHIDMNWMWGYNETAALTVDTFRTILQLMKEYPAFTYAQSQASTYEIIEKYCPELLPEIRARIREGRWEVNAVEWVEPDKNMPDGESLTRHILQSRKYLTKLLDISEEALCIDFVPDTFGHNLNVPEILQGAGVRYMYHCRGLEGPCIYWYQSPSGKRTLNYREYKWYNGFISTEKFEIVPAFCRQEKVDTYLCVYGVGDHGGGPSRRDIERILTYQSWPLTPNIRFGTFRDFFRAIEQQRTDYPVVDHEMNALFTGCYTTQSRIKMANRIAEARMNDTELLSAEATLLAGAPPRQQWLDSAWRNILFNHFHDILPGSGTVETREYAMGKFQETLAKVNTFGGTSMRAIADAIDTSSVPVSDERETVSEGGGVGYAQNQALHYAYPLTERGRGKVRIVHLYNTTQYDRDEFSLVTLWDYPYDRNAMEIRDPEGRVLPFAVTETGSSFWSHTFIRLLVKAKVPAFGYTTVVIGQRTPEGHLVYPDDTYELLDEFIQDRPITLENEYLSATFDRRSMHLVSLVERESGRELIDRPACLFELVDENPVHGMTAWRVGYYKKITDIGETGDVKYCGFGTDASRSRLTYQVRFGSSDMRVEIVLKKGSRTLEFSLHIDWNEAAVVGEKVPQLRFSVPVGYAATGRGIYDIPYGLITRESFAHDVPALSMAYAQPAAGCGLGLVTDSKYGYRLWDNNLSVTLIRSAYDPDPYPERGIHDIRIGVIAAGQEETEKEALLFNRPIIAVSGTAHAGTLPMSGRALQVNGSVRVSCVKNAENGEGIAVRVYNAAEKPENVEVILPGMREACLADLCENRQKALPVSGGKTAFTAAPYCVYTVLLQ